MRLARERERSPRAGPVATLALGVALAACEDVSAYSTGEGESYCGAITLGRSFREGIGPRAQMRLALDASRLDAQTSPGRVWAWEPATEVQAERAWLDGVALEPFAPLAHDALGDLEFGEGRERNTVYALRPATGAEGMLAVLSLRTDGRVEVRLLRPGRGGTDAEDASPVYGVFLLERRRGTCGLEDP